jgi:hypothetical protein
MGALLTFSGLRCVVIRPHTVTDEDSGEAARLFRDDGARDSEMMPPGSAATLADVFVAPGLCRRQPSNLC